MSRRLEPGDVLYRVIDPDHRDQQGVLVTAFQDPGKPYKAQSFFVARAATPRDALGALAPYRRAKKICNTGNVPPNAEQMYGAGYRVVRVSAAFVLEGIQQTKDSQHPLSINRDGLPAGDDFSDVGHLDLTNCRFNAEPFPDNSEMLSKAETLGHS